MDTFQLSSTTVPEKIVTHERRRWSVEEDEFLRDEVARYEETTKTIDWTRVSRGLHQRSNKDCRKRWLKIDPKWNQGAWAIDEDDRLRKGVGQYQTRWKAVSDTVQTRNPDQCAKRWRNSVDPNILRSGWSSDEDLLLLKSVEELGRNWKAIAELYFCSRSRLDLSNRYTMLTRRKHSVIPLRSPARAGRRLECNSGDQIMDDFFHTRSDQKPDLTHSRSQSYGWSSNSGFHEQTLAAQAPALSNLAQSESSYIVEHESIHDGWSHQSFGTPVNDGSLGVANYASQSHLFQDPVSGYSCMTDIDAQAHSTASSSILSSPAPVKMEPYFPFSETNRHEDSASPSSKTSLTLDNLDSPTRAAILDLVCKGNKPVTVVID